MTSTTSALAWLAERPRLLADKPPASTSACACGHSTVLVILDSPSGPYAVCPSCVGKDMETRGPRTPTSIPAPAPKKRR